MKKLLPILLLLCTAAMGQPTITNIVPTKVFYKGDGLIASGKTATANGDTVVIASETDSTGIVPFRLKGSNQPDTISIYAGTQSVSKTVKYQYKQGKLILGVR